MKRIVPKLDSLEQHQKQLRDDPDAYRPERCPHCGKAGVHCHGHYERNAPRGEGMAMWLEMLFIPRFYCPACRRTCSRLPACLSPRRQYWWKTQQAVLEGLLKGASIRELARGLWPSRRTIGRWWRALQARFDELSFSLRSRFPQLGRAEDGKAFWSNCFEQMSLTMAMSQLDQAGISVP